MNLFSASGQESTTIDNETLSKYVRTCEKCEADKVDMGGIINEQKLIIETLGIRVIELENTIDGLTDAIGKVKTAYEDIIDTTEKKKFWIWLKGVGVGILVGAVTIIVLVI